MNESEQQNPTLLLFYESNIAMSRWSCMLDVQDSKSYLISVYGLSDLIGKIDCLDKRKAQQRLHILVRCSVTNIRHRKIHPN